MQWSCQVPKESYMAHSISDLHFTDKSQPRVFQSACGIAPSQVRDATLECPGCVTRHDFMFFCLSCPLVRCSLPTRWIQNFCVGWRNCFRGREPTQKLSRQRTRNYFLRGSPSQSWDVPSDRP